MEKSSNNNRSEKEKSMDWYVIHENDSLIQMQSKMQNVPAYHKVLVASMPGDMETAMEIGKEILSIMNCEILIAKEDGLNGEALKDLFAEVKMVVFVISRSFMLTSDAPCRAAFQAAIETPGLRRLLIQTEKNIEREFDRLVGHYQLVDRTAEDYIDKLSIFIDGHADPYTMIGSEAELKMWDSLLTFKIFISYRKKDIAYLKRIMTAIRSCPQLMDASLWYDNSLISGENYNEQIDGALKTADLVLFAVTDHFVEEGNYVLTSEYPRTIEEGKPVVSVLMEDTDQADIQCYYPQLKTLIPFEDTESWLNAILKIGSDLGKIDANPSTEKIYMLARKYEDGVETTSDPDAALKLYRLAAEGGNPRAMKRLAEIYIEGKKVERDPEKAVALRQAALASFEKELKADSTPTMTKMSNLKSMYNIAGDLFNYFYVKKEYDNAREMLRFQRDAREAGLKIGVGIIPIDLYQKEALLHKTEGEYQEALESFNRLEEVIPLAEINEHNPSYADPDTIYMKGFIAKLHLYVNRGDVHRILFMEGDKTHFWEALLDLRAAMELFLQLEDLQSLTQFIPNVHEFLIATVADLRILAQTAEQIDGGMSLAQQIYEEVCLQLGSLLKTGGTPELLNQYGVALMDAAMAGRSLPDKKKLEQAKAIYDTLCSSFPNATRYVDNRYIIDSFLFMWPASSDMLKTLGMQPAVGRWLLVQIDPTDAMKIFNFPDYIPEGYYGDIVGNYQVSGYRCPHCGQRLYKTIFPEERVVRLPISLDLDGSQYIEPARVFACPCGRFFATQKGKRLVEGQFYQNIFDLQKQKQQEGFAYWWNLLNEAGDLYARRRD